MADAAAHHKQMKDLMGAEGLMLCVKDGELQCVNDAACGIDKSTGQKPEETGEGKRMKQSAEYQYTDPAHGNVDD